jgi:hypothetical protein
MKHSTASCTAPAWPSIEQSLLWRNGGYLVTRILSDQGLEMLLAEALAQREECAEHNELLGGYRQDERGRADGRLESAPGGPILDALYHSDKVLQLLHRVTGVRWRPAGPKGTFSYYRSHDFLGRHRDIHGCDLAAITCIMDTGGCDSGDSGRLAVYQSSRSDQVDEMPVPRAAACVKIRMRAGDSVILLGGIIDHEVCSLRTGHFRVVAPLCYVPI